MGHEALAPQIEVSEVGPVTAEELRRETLLKDNERIEREREEQDRPGREA